MGRFKDALLLLSLLVVSEAMPHGQSSEETTTGSHESGSESSKSTGGSGSHEYGDVTGLPLNIDQTMVHFEGGESSLNYRGAETESLIMFFFSFLILLFNQT